MLLALLLPGLSMLLAGHLFRGILCAFLQATIVGWLPAAVWAVMLRRQETVLSLDEHREVAVAIQTTQVPA